MMSPSTKVVLGALVATGMGVLLNVTANVLKPIYAPSVARWGWFFILSGFILWAGDTFGFGQKLYTSWIQANCRPLWILTAITVASVSLFSIHLGVNALWDKIGLKVEDAEGEMRRAQVLSTSFEQAGSVKDFV